MMRKLLALILLLCALSGAAAADDFGQSYIDFQTLYAENVHFINENTGRFLLPLDFSGEFDAEGERIYVISSGALQMEIKLDDLAEQIAYCHISLTAPADMTYGDSKHNDFTVSGYHSYALLMAMSKAETALERYRLVEEVNAGIAENAGLYETQVGDYRLKCLSANGTATMRFENELLMGTGLENTAEEETAEAEITIHE